MVCQSCGRYLITAKEYMVGPNFGKPRTLPAIFNDTTMIQPTEEQILFIKRLVTTSLDQLIAKDSDIFNIGIEMPQQISPDARLLNRELHETTINHRLAFYLEQNIQETDLEFYNVDIEYNRYYSIQKRLNTVEGQLSVRPDILIHTRINDHVEQQHYLAVEAKKAEITPHDINKIEGFISDPNYLYLFGLTISYCINETNVLANLYYFNGTTIVKEEINRPK